jgi:P-type Mg2+ transporter
MSDWAEPQESLLRRLASSGEGIADAEAKRRLRTAARPVGTRHLTTLQLALRQFSNPIIVILLGVAAVSALLGEASQSLIVIGIVVLSSALGFVQERGAVRAVQALLGSVSVHADVIRDGHEREVSVEHVVPGDVVVLRAGDVVPGDGRVIRSNHLRLDESSLTGEAFPRHKTSGVVDAATPLAQRSNMVHLGSYVASGEGRAVVTRTGADTEFGRIGSEVAARHLPTAFERGITSFGYMLMRATAVLVTVIFVVNVVVDRPVIDSILFSLALAVGLTPQMLPAIVTLSLSRGAVAMAKSKVIVKRLDAIEDVGSLDVLCTDKTGTITVGSVTVQESLDADGNDDPDVLRWAWLTARDQRGFPNPLDDAILRDARSATVSIPRRLSTAFDDDWSYEGEVPFDFARKRMTVVVRSKQQRLLVTKGALEPLLERCVAVARRDGNVVLTAEPAAADDDSRGVRGKLMHTY